jgi:hypothetical protein
MVPALRARAAAALKAADAAGNRLSANGIMMDKWTPPTEGANSRYSRSCNLLRRSRDRC